MREFTSHYNEKEITFTEEGIRYNNEIFIKYRDMRDISHRTEGRASIVFRYKDRLVRMYYNPDDKPEIMPYLAIAMQISKEAEREEAMSPAAMKQEESPMIPGSHGELDKYSYLDNYQAQAPAEEKPKKKKTGLIIAVVALVVVLAAVAAFVLLR